MKKAILFTLAALCVSATQAVTLTWTHDATNATTSSSVRKKDQGIYANRSATVGAAVTYGSTLGTGAILSVGAAHSSKTFSVLINSAGEYVFEASSDVTNGTVTAGATVKAEAGGAQVVTISLYRPSGTSVSIAQAAINGVVIGTIENATIKEGSIEYVEWGRKVGNFGNYTQSATYDVWDTIAGGNAAYLTADAAYNKMYELTGVPEPTALALLALGVAGLALRRRVA